MFTAELFIITPSRKSSKYPSIVEWINAPGYIYITDYHTGMGINIIHITAHTTH